MFVARTNCGWFATDSVRASHAASWIEAYISFELGYAPEIRELRMLCPSEPLPEGVRVV